MKRLIIANIIIIVGIFLAGCTSQNKSNAEINSETTIINKKSNAYTSNINLKGEGIFNYRARNVDEFKSWITNTESKKDVNGEFESLIKLYNEQYKHITIPEISGCEIEQVFVDSNSSNINYVFNKPSIRICVEPIDIDENSKYDKTNICNFMVEKYGIEFNKNKNIRNSTTESQNKTGYEYNKILYEIQDIKIGTETRKCVLGYMYSEKSKTQHIINFIEENVLVRIIYFDENKEINIDELDDLSFERVTLE